MRIEVLALACSAAVLPSGLSEASDPTLHLDQATAFARTGTQVSWNQLILGSRLEDVEKLFGSRASWITSSSCGGMYYHLDPQPLGIVGGFMPDEKGVFLSSISIRVSDGMTPNHADELHLDYLDRISEVVKERIGPLLFIPRRLDPTQAEEESFSRAYQWGSNPDVRVHVTVDWVTVTMSAERDGRPIVLPKKRP